MTVRFKLTMATIAVILVANAVLSLVGLEYAERAWLSEVQYRVRLDLNSARATYQSRIDHTAQYLAGIAAASRGRLGDGEVILTHDEIHAAFQGADTDVFALLNGEGRVLYRPGNPSQHSDDLTSHPLIQQVIESKERATGTVLLSDDMLAREGPTLAERARFELIPTPAARATDERMRSEGMVAAAAIPLLDMDGVLRGILYAGNLLNRRFEIVDAIRSEVFASEVHEGRPIGTVTIFQDDLRISTNVSKEDGSRAVGTRLSDVVYQEVLERGGTWADRAFVFNDWYLTAYEPIRDPDGQIIGALYVGLLEAPFLDRKNMITGRLLVMLSMATLASLALILVVTNLVLKPIGRIIAMSHRVVDGDLTARVEIDPPGEMGELCRAVDGMAEAVCQREERLKLATSRQITQSEKLASIGRLASGIAHEINNPLTSILTFAHLLREKEPIDEQDTEDLDLIIHETKRAADIVQGLLDFARERPAVKEPLSLNDVVRRTVRLIRNQKLFRGVTIEEQLSSDLPAVNGDTNRLQQVVLNLCLNAREAMEDGGTIHIGTRTKEGQVILEVRDTGHGIKPEDLEQVFEPFFSTKPVGQGTGLGLSVTYGIVDQHSGRIEVDSEEGTGTTFTVLLPSLRKE
jgi:two-component system, NtrC family, sensor kinase